MNDIDLQLANLTEDYRKYCSSVLSEAKVNSMDVRALFKYLAHTRKDPRGVVSKINDFPAYIKSSAPYKLAIDAINTHGLRGDLYVADKIRDLGLLIKTLVSKSDVGPGAIKGIEDISNLNKKYPALAPVIFSVMSTIRDKLKSNDADIDNFIDLSKYNIGKYIETQSTRQDVPTSSVSPEDNISKIMIASNISDAYRKNIIKSYNSADKWSQDFIDGFFKRVLDTPKEKRNAYILKNFALLKIISDNSFLIMNKKKIISLYNESVKNKKAFNYYNSFLKALGKSSDKNKYAQQWIPYIEKTLSSKEINESKLYEFDFLKRKLKLLGQRTGLLDKDAIDFDGLMNIWDAHGKPNEISDIIEILKDVGFSSREVKSAFKKIGVDIENSLDNDIEKLYRIIKKYELKDQVIKFLDRFYPKDRAKAKLTESVGLSAKEISSIFKDVVSASSQFKTTAKLAKDGIDIDYLYNWVSNIKSADETEKKQLVAEIVDYLSEHSDENDWQKASGFVSRTLTKSNLDPKVLEIALAKIKSGFAYRQNTKESVNAETVNFLEFLSEELDVELPYLFNEQGNMFYLTSKHNDSIIDEIFEGIAQTEVLGRKKR